jgi:NAD(P)-dependent dehydrogenase (short-subunit alcohol dehydrogenase family)
MELAGAVVVVTGAAGSMGPKIVEKLESLGATPVGWDLYVADGDKSSVQCNVADAASVEAAMEQTVAGWGVPTGLVTVAAVSGGASPIAAKATDDEWDRVLTGPADWERVLATNVTGVANCMRAFARRLAEEKRPGAIVNISSISSGPVVEPGLVAYSASKAALNQLTRVAAAELGPLGIRVNAVGPGVMADPMIGPTRINDGIIKPSDSRPSDFALGIKKYVPLEQRHGRGEDIAEAVCGVLQMEWVTGQIVFADGGLTLRSPVTT